MKKISILIFCICFVNLINAQILPIDLVEKLMEANLFDRNWDSYIEKGYGFNKKEKDEDRTWTYYRFYKNDNNSYIIIRVLLDKENTTVIEILLTKNIDLRSVKDELLNRGYNFNGLSKYGFTLYKNSELYFMITDEPNNYKNNKIIVTENK